MGSVRLKPSAPRFHALLERTEGKPVFILRRSVWASFSVEIGSPVLLTTQDLADAPVARAPTCLAAEAKRTDQRVELAIYRVDLGDDPDLINVDRW